MKKALNFAKRSVLKLAPLAVAASCTGDAHPTRIKVPVTPSATTIPEKTIVDLEPERQKHLKQMREALVERVLSTKEQLVINLALRDVPGVREELNRLIEKHRGRIMDVVDDVALQVSSLDGALGLLNRINDSTATNINTLKKRVTGLVKSGCDALIDQSPTVSQATSSDIEKNYDQHLVQLEADLRKWAHEAAERLLDLDLDEIQAHVDQYDPKKNNMRNDMTIAYLPNPRIVESFQGQFHEVFDLYLQLAHGNKADVVFPAGPKKLEALFMNPDVKRLAVVGHGNWTGVSDTGSTLPPERAIAMILLEYKKDPKAFIQGLEQKISKKKEGYAIAKGVMAFLSQKVPQKYRTGNRGFYDDRARTPAERSKITDDAYSNGPYAGAYPNLYVDVDPNDPARQKEIYRYTCGGDRYSMDNTALEGAKRYQFVHKAPDLPIDAAWYPNNGQKHFSAKHSSFVGKYEADMLYRAAFMTRWRIVEDLQKTLAGCKGNTCPDRRLTYKLEHKNLVNGSGSVERSKVQAKLNKVKSQPLSVFAPEVHEQPGFGSTFGKTHGYEGQAYLPQYLRNPLMENMGGLQNFKLPEKQKD